MNRNECVLEIVDALFEDLNGRAGFETSEISPKVIREWKAHWAGIIEGRAFWAGATGKFPDGKLNEDDERELQIVVSSKPEKRIVLCEFGKPVSWIALDSDSAWGLAKVIAIHANNLKKKEIITDVCRED